MSRKSGHKNPRGAEMTSAPKDCPISDSGKLFRLLYDHLPVMVHSVNREGILVHANERWLSELDYTLEDVRGRPLSDFLTETSGKE